MSLHRSMLASRDAGTPLAHARILAGVGEDKRQNEQEPGGNAVGKSIKKAIPGKSAELRFFALSSFLKTFVSFLVPDAE